MLTARAVVPFGLGLDLQFSDTASNCQRRVNQAQYLQFIFFQEIPVSKCFGVFLLCFAWLGFLFCCLGRAVGSVVRCLGAISAEVDVKFFLIFFFLSRVVSLLGSVCPSRWLCWQEAEGTAGQGRGTGAAPAHLGSGSCQPGTAETSPALEHSN